MSIELPTGLNEFLAEAGWGGAQVEPLAGDASFRRYFRIRDGARTAMLMDAPPPEEDPRPFIHVGNWLSAQGLRAPAIHAAWAARGLVLLEDFGNLRMRDWLDDHPADEGRIYAAAISTLAQLHRCQPGPFAPYDMDVYLREVMLFPEWFCPAAGIVVDAASYGAAWREALEEMMARQQPGVTVLRDYHAENIMLLDPEASDGGAQGLIDFQDALVGHRAYDLVSLLQDARRDVSPALEAEMLALYGSLIACDDDFAADYARLGAQRNAKIVGIFARLWKRDGKPRYLSMIPRVWEAMERDLSHPAMAPVARWFDANVPADIRNARGGGSGMSQPAKPLLASDTAMVLAAGLGKRMRPLTASKPKPMVRVAGQPMIDHALDKLADAGIAQAVVNVHYLGDVLEAHLAGRKRPKVIISDERDLLLETGGGMVKAADHLPDPFFSLNSDNLWLDGPRNCFHDLSRVWDAERMDALLLVVPHTRAENFQGLGDFHMDASGKLSRRAQSRIAPFIFTGIQLVSKRLLRDAPRGPFSTNLLWDRALTEGRLFGLAFSGRWFEVGTPQAIAPTEAVLRDG